MKILIITPYLPHPRSGHGTGVFMYGLIEGLVRNQDVTLVSFCDKNEMLLAGDLKKLRLTLHTIPRDKGGAGQSAPGPLLAFQRLFQFEMSFLRWEPYFVSKWRSGVMSDLIRKLTAGTHYDVVQIEFPMMGHYVSHVQNGKTFLHAHDVAFRPAYRRYKKSSSFFAKIFFFIEWCRWAGYEKAVIRKFDRVLTVTGQDTQLVEWLTGAGNARYLPRSVDYPATAPPAAGRKAADLLFVGSFSHQPNVDAARWLCAEIFPRIVKKYPDARLRLVGAHPPQELALFARHDERIVLTGFVDDLTPLYDAAGIFVAPLRFGGGVKLKILHAMAHALPVVTTHMGAEGIEGIGMDSAGISETADGIAALVCSLIGNRPMAEAMGKNGRELVRAHYSRDRVVDRLEEIYRDACRAS